MNTILYNIVSKHRQQGGHGPKTADVPKKKKKEKNKNDDDDDEIIIIIIIIIIINPLKTKSRPLYLKTQFVPRCKHF
jgi:hypothetical protein